MESWARRPGRLCIAFRKNTICPLRELEDSCRSLNQFIVIGAGNPAEKKSEIFSPNCLVYSEDKLNKDVQKIGRRKKRLGKTNV
jgi:hypothetical protein